MRSLRELKSHILRDGEDARIDDADWALIRKHLPAGGRLAPDDVMALLELRTEARAVCADFDAFFFPALKAFLLADGQVSLTEQFHLLRMLYGGVGIDAAERKFLQELRAELPQPDPQFEQLFQTAMSD